MSADRLLEMAEAVDTACVECGLRPLLTHPQSGRPVLLDAKVYEDEDGHFYVRCNGC